MPPVPPSRQRNQEFSLTYREVVDILTLIRGCSDCRSAYIEIGDFKLSMTGHHAEESPVVEEPPRAATASIGSEPRQPRSRDAFDRER